VRLPILLSVLLLSSIPMSAAQEEGAWMLHIFDKKYAPDPLEVPVGSTIAIMNVEAVDDPEGIHTVTASSDPALFDVQQIKPGGEPRTFTAPSTPGTYSYYCRYHGDAQGNGMAGTLIVTAAAGTPSPSPGPSASPSTQNESPAPWLGLVLVAVGGTALLARRT
jgi:plastocyanin